MFSESDLKIIEDLSFKYGGSKIVIASAFGMLLSKFEENFSESEPAQLAYEKGLAKQHIGIITEMFDSSKKGDMRATQYISKNMLEIESKGSNKKEVKKTSTSNQHLAKDSLALNPLQIFEYTDNYEVARKAQKKESTEDKIEGKDTEY